jgi:hypothetical protein
VPVNPIKRAIKGLRADAIVQFSFDRNRIAEKVKSGAMGVNRRSQFLITSRVLWTA